MRALTLYSPDNEYTRSVLEFSRNLESRSNLKLELIDKDTVEGSSVANLYGVVDYPAIIVVSDNGTLHKMWQGSQLPLIDEVVSYLMA